MIYDDLKKILKEKYCKYYNYFNDNIIEEKFLSIETIKNNPYYILLNENTKDDYNSDLIDYINHLPKGFTYRPVNEYIELITKIIIDIREKYLNSLTQEQANYVNQNIQSYEERMKLLPKEEKLENSINFWKILIEATKLYKFARDKSLENIRKSVNIPQKEKSKPRTNQMTISDYEKELDKRKGKLRKKGIDALIDKIKAKEPQSTEPQLVKPQPIEPQLNNLDGEDLSLSLPQQTTLKSTEDELKSLTSMEKFLLSVKDDIDQEMYKTALSAIQNAKTNPTQENIQLAKELVDKALES